jgi:hypothetical protein
LIHGKDKFLTLQQSVESEVQEVLKGFAGAVRLGPNERAFVAIEQESG